MSDLPELNPDRTLIFRIVHRDNVPWILDNGLHCRASARHDPTYVVIGNPELIEKRRSRSVPVFPGGTLSDYVSFYFTPRSPMLLNIRTGYGGIRQRDSREIVIIAASLRMLSTAGVPLVFTDRHAYLQTARFFDDVTKLGEIDWTILRRSDFKASTDDHGKMERYQAEVLVHNVLGVEQIGGLACYDADTKLQLTRWIDERGLDMKAFVRRAWYFA